MLQDIFYWVFNMSIASVITGVIVMLIRHIKKIPRRLTVFLWAVPFLRMAVPIGLSSPYSLMSLISKFTTKTVVVYQPAKEVDVSMTNYTMAADTYFPVTFKENLLDDIFNIASVIWIIVFLTILIILAVVYCKTIKEMKGAKHMYDNIYLSDSVTSPGVYGIIKPKIILPTSYKEKDIDLILLHEKVHIRRCDNLWRVLALLVVSAHWFNPLCWIFLKSFLTDIELSCDECVLVKLGGSRAKEYANSLLESKESNNVFASAFGGSKIKTRIENILSFKRITGVSLLIFLMLMTAISYVLLTNAG